MTTRDSAQHPQDDARRSAEEAARRAEDANRSEGVHRVDDGYGVDDVRRTEAGSRRREATRPAASYPATHRQETEPIAGGPAPAWGAPAEEWERGGDRRAGRTWSTRKTAATAAIAIAVTGGAAAAAYGLSSAADSSSSQGQGGPGGMGGGMGGGQAGGTGQAGAGQSGDGSGAAGQSGQQGGTGQSGTGQSGTGQSGTGAGGTAQGGAPGMGAAGLGIAGGQPLYSQSVTEQNGEYVTTITQTGTVEKISDSSVTVKSSDGHTQVYTVSDSSLVSGISTGDEVMASGTKKDDAVTLVSLQAAQSGTGSTGSGSSGAGGASGG
ncbi:hypothetical protein M4A02_08405, partial [Rothia kristinae]